jgi:hypothetical protein
MSDEPKDPSSLDANTNEATAQPDDEDQGAEYDPVGKYDRTFGYMETERGHEVTLRFVAILEQLSPVLKTLLEAKVAAQRARPKLDFWRWVLLLAVRLIVFAVAVWALIYMRKVGTIDPAIALLIGGLVAYFFGYNKSQS